jgi:hypothetical protein
MRRSFRTVSEPLAFALHLRNGRDQSVRVHPVGRVLRRLVQLVLPRLWMPMHFALQLIRRAAAPWSPALRAAPSAAPPPRASPGILREHIQLSTQLLERRLCLVQTRYARTPVSVVPAAPSGVSQDRSSARVTMMQRIERQMHFPRVTQVVVRTPSAAWTRAQAGVALAPQTPERRLVLRAEAPAASAAVAASLAPAELSLVTEHVIRQLDQRVLSYRERTGQV